MKYLPTVNIGRHNTTEGLLQDLQDRHVKFGSWGRLLLDRVQLSTKSSQIKLVVTHIIKDLGLTDFHLFNDIVTAGAGLGLQPCTSEEIFEARLDYIDQVNDEVLIAMMIPELIQDDSSGKPVESKVLLTLERLSNLGIEPWIRGISSVIDPYQNSGLPTCWNPYSHDSRRLVLFRAQ